MPGGGCLVFSFVAFSRVAMFSILRWGDGGRPRFSIRRADESEAVPRRFDLYSFPLPTVKKKSMMTYLDGVPAGKYVLTFVNTL
jgi:hypothetical protein